MSIWLASRVSTWKTPFEAYLDGRSPSQLSVDVRVKSAGWFKRGLRVSIKGSRLRARYNEMSGYSVAPLLKAQVRAADGGTAVSGNVYWTVLIGGRIVSAIGLAVFAVLTVVFIVHKDWFAIVWAFAAAMFGLSLATLWGDVRREEEDRLRRELDLL